MESDQFSEGVKPILGTGLNNSSFQKILTENGHASTALAAAEGNPSKQHRAPVAKKPMTRTPLHHTSQTPSVVGEPRSQCEKEQGAKTSEENSHDGLFHQVYEWLQQEKVKQKSRRSKLRGTGEGVESDGDDDYYDGIVDKTASHDSESTFALDKLEKILVRYAASRIEGSSSAIHYGDRPASVPASRVCAEALHLSPTSMILTRQFPLLMQYWTTPRRSHTQAGPPKKTIGD